MRVFTRQISRFKVAFKLVVIDNEKFPIFKKIRIIRLRSMQREKNANESEGFELEIGENFIVGFKFFHSYLL